MSREGMMVGRSDVLHVRVVCVCVCVCVWVRMYVCGMRVWVGGVLMGRRVS